MGTNNYKENFGIFQVYTKVMRWNNKSWFFFHENDLLRIKNVNKQTHFWEEKKNQDSSIKYSLFDLMNLLIEYLQTKKV